MSRTPIGFMQRELRRETSAAERESFVPTLQYLNRYSVASTESSFNTPYESEPPERHTSSQSRSLQRLTVKPLAETASHAATASECSTLWTNSPESFLCSNRSMQNFVVSDDFTGT